MNFVVVTFVPRRQGFLAPIPEKITIDECEGESVEEVKDTLHVPLDGYCLIAEEKDITRVNASVTKEMAPFRS